MEPSDTSQPGLHTVGQFGDSERGWGGVQYCRLGRSDSEPDSETFLDCEPCGPAAGCGECRDQARQDSVDGLGLDQGEDGESLEFEYEPGISLCSLQSYTHTAAYLQEESDLQLAAELGKTLLERNKELELSLKHQQGVIEDQSLEIEYLTKQTAALREVNESRLKIYEQLEVGMVELEAGNSRLREEAGQDRERARSLGLTVNLLEQRCEELQRQLDQARLHTRLASRESSIETRQETRQEARRDSREVLQAAREEEVNTFPSSFRQQREGVELPGLQRVSPGPAESGYCSACTDSLGSLGAGQEAGLELQLAQEEVTSLAAQLERLQTSALQAERRAKELEDQVSCLLSENAGLVQQQLELVRTQQQRPTRQASTVLQEVTAAVATRRSCSKCFSLSADPAPPLALQARALLQEIWFELGTGCQVSVSRLLSHLSHCPASPAWLDCALLALILCSALLAAARAAVTAVANSL